MALSLDSKIKDILRSPEGRAVMENGRPVPLRTRP